jgi:hypothetical protein
MLTVALLLYGDHPDLARRLLDSLAVRPPAAGLLTDVRIGLNSVCEETRSFVREFCERARLPVPCTVFEPPTNVGKYPLMRRMFQDRPLPPQVMWFDDDSYLGRQRSPDWWGRTVDFADHYGQIGRVHFIRQRSKQYLAIPRQPWFNGEPVSQTTRFRFITGGWWVAKSALLNRWDYPFPALHHNGGDSILGELWRQRSVRIGDYTGAYCHCQGCLKIRKGRTPEDGVHINASPRRGLGRRGEHYVWQDGNPTPDLSHQNFALTISRYS